MNFATRDTRGRLVQAPVSQKIFDALTRRPYGLTCHELVDAVYGDREDGGPDWARSSISVTVMRMNRWFAKQGHSLRVRSRSTGRGGGPGSRYQIWIVR